MFQFSLKTLFIVTTGFSVLVWILFVPPEWLGILVLAGIYTLPAANLAGLLYHRGMWQAFFVGTAPPVVITTWLTIGGFSSPRFFSGSGMQAIQVKLLMIYLLIMIGLCGLVAVAVRSWARAINEEEREVPRGEQE